MSFSYMLDRIGDTQLDKKHGIDTPLTSPEIIQETIEKIAQIKERLKATHIP